MNNAKLVVLIISLLTVGTIVAMSFLWFILPVKVGAPKENISNSKVKNEFVVSSKAHIKDVVCRYTIISTDTLYTINMVDACSKWDVHQPIVFKQQ